MSRTEIWYDPVDPARPEATVVGDDVEMLAEHYSLGADEDLSRLSPWLLRYELSRVGAVEGNAPAWLRCCAFTGCRRWNNAVQWQLLACGIIVVASIQLYFTCGEPYHLHRPAE